MSSINRPNIRDLAENYPPTGINHDPQFRDAMRCAYLDGIRAMKNSVLAIIHGEKEYMEQNGAQMKEAIESRIELLFDDDLVTPRGMEHDDEQ